MAGSTASANRVAARNVEPLICTCLLNTRIKQAPIQWACRVSPWHDGRTRRARRRRASKTPRRWSVRCSDDNASLLARAVVVELLVRGREPTLVDPMAGRFPLLQCLLERAPALRAIFQTAQER